MKTIKNYGINWGLFVCIGLLAVLFTVEVEAMQMSSEGAARAQRFLPKIVKQTEEYQWTDKEIEQKNQREVAQSRRIKFINQMKKSPYFFEFQQKLLPNEMGKGWFQGPLERWKNDIVIVMFELLKPFKILTDSNSSRSYLLSEIRKEMSAYDKTCYLHISNIDDEVGTINTKLNNLIAFSNAPSRVQPIFFNTYLFIPGRVLEGQALYDQLRENRQKREIERRHREENIRRNRE